MNYRKRVHEVVVAALVSGALFSAIGVYGEGSYPSDYKPSKPAEKGDTSVLARFAAVSTYMNDKLNAAGGNDSPLCYRNCLTVAMNDVLKCLETKTTYVASESCEQDSSQKMAACNPKCQ